MKGKCERIISDETFQIAEDVLSRKSPRKKKDITYNDYALGGLVFCADCGRRMISKTIKCNVYHVCGSIQNVRDCPNTRHHRVEDIERYLIANVIRDYSQMRIMIEEKPTKKKNPANLIKRQARFKELYLDGQIELDEYKRETAKLQMEIDRINYENSKVAIPEEKIATVLSTYNELSPAARHSFWSSLISRITVSSEDEITITFR